MKYSNYFKKLFIVMKKIIIAGLIAWILSSTTFADLNGSVEIKDEKWNAIGQSRMIDIMPISIEQTNQLSQNDQNFVNHTYDTLSENDVEILNKLNELIDSRLENKTKLKQKSILDALVEDLEQEVYKLIMKYPADAPMSKADTRVYLMLNTLKLETYAKSW